MRILLQFGIAALLAGMVSATTLERLTLEDMVQKSMSIVRGRVLDSTSVQRGNVIYTVYRLQVSERLKGAGGASSVEVYVPGGAKAGYRQSFAGSPVMETGAEYVVFIWTSPRGINQAIGMGQGVFDVKAKPGSETVLSRGTLDAQMVDATGRAVEDQGLKLTLGRLRQVVTQAEASKAEVQ
ncbi:MAG: hypothetical protein HY858_01815 [Candidatus Solibacter usitatus]|nr:hypothetical protein [Candidatus Solibacter usitatus]